MNIVTFQSAKDGQFYFRVRAKNNKIIATSEAYKTKAKRDQTVKRFVEAFRSETPVAQKDVGLIVYSKRTLVWSNDYKSRG